MFRLFSKGNQLLSESYLLPRSVEGGTPIARDCICFFFLVHRVLSHCPRNILFPPLPAFPCIFHHSFHYYAVMHVRILPYFKRRINLHAFIGTEHKLVVAVLL